MRLVSFDFDDTLCLTPLEPNGKVIYKEKTGSDFPNVNWWKSPLSLDTKIFDIPVNKWVYDRYLIESNDPDNYMILVTGRVESLRDEVQEILDMHNLNFKEVHLNPGIHNTYDFKLKLFKDKIKELGVDEFYMFDDRAEHIKMFKEWSLTVRDVRIKIFDVVKDEVFDNFDIDYKKIKNFKDFLNK